MRKQMFETVSEIVSSDKNTSLFLVDIGVMGFKDVLENHPDRCMNVGIFEDGMISVAAGLALEGITPIIYGISPFIVGRAFEQLKLDFGYQNLGGNFITTGASYDFAKLGHSHYCPEDIGLIQMIPEFQFVAPATKKEFDTLFRQTYNNGKPTYYRLTDYVNKTECDVEFGEATVIKRGMSATVIAVSTMLDMVIEACGDLDVTILYYSTLLPFDKDAIMRTYSDRALLCEPHFEGSLAYHVIKALEPEYVKIDFVGLPREYFRNYGTKQEKDIYYGLTVEEIRRKAKLLIRD